MTQLKKQQKSVLIIEHIIEDLEVAAIILIQKGTNPM